MNVDTLGGAHDKSKQNDNRTHLSMSKRIKPIHYKPYFFCKWTICEVTNLSTYGYGQKLMTARIKRI